MYIYPVSSIEILSCLKFQERFTKLVPKIPKLGISSACPEGTGYYGIHFRLEIDAIVHYLFDDYCYDDFMNKCNCNDLSKNFCNNFIKLQEVKQYIDYLLKQYIQFIKHFGFDKPWYISTLIGKKDVHNCLIPTLKKITDFIEFNGGSIIKNEQHFEERELNALIDLITLRDSDKMIGFEGSSFSEGYCFKVNSVKRGKCVKEYRFVNGIVNKISNEIYQSC